LVTIEKIATKTNMISRFIVSDFQANNEQEVVRLVEKTLYQELCVVNFAQWLGQIKHERENSGGRQLKIMHEQDKQIKV